MTNVRINNKGVTEQKSKNFSASFNADCLVVSEKMTTLYTHTHSMRTYYSATLFHFFLRARKEHVNRIGKELKEVFLPFVSCSLVNVSNTEKTLPDHLPSRK